MKRLELTPKEAVVLKMCLFNQGVNMRELLSKGIMEDYLREQLHVLESIWYKLKEDE